MLMCVRWSSSECRYQLLRNLVSVACFGFLKAELEWAGLKAKPKSPAAIITLSDVQIVPRGKHGQRAPHREKGEEISSVKNWLLSYRGRWSELGPIWRLEMRMKPEAFLDEADALTWSRVDNNESSSKQVWVCFWGSIGSTFFYVYLLRLFQLWLKSLIPHWSFVSWKHQINLALLFL